MRSTASTKLQTRSSEELGIPFRSGWDTGYPGAILADPGSSIVRWHCRTETMPVSVLAYLIFFRKPGILVVLDCEEREILRIRRKSRLPTRFNMVQNGEVVRTIGFGEASFEINTRSCSKQAQHGRFICPCSRSTFTDSLVQDSQVWVVSRAFQNAMDSSR